MKKIKDILLIAVPTAVCAAAGSIVTALNKDYPKTLKLPSLYPPSLVFAIVWTAIFILAVIAGAVALKKSETKKEREDTVFIYNIQLIFNLLWSVCFFGIKMPWLAFAEIILFLAIIIVMAVNYGKISKISGFLLLPYILWVSFAAFFLNLPIAIMN